MIHPDVFREFQIQVKKYYKVRAIYMCETDKGIKAIRISDYKPEQINYQYKLKQHLVKNGFEWVDQLYVSKKNTPYVAQYDKLYIMTDWNNGPEVDFYNIQDINKTIRTLAYMHRAGVGFKPPPTSISSVKIKNLGKTYRKRYNETIKLRKKINSVSNKTDFELLYLKSAPVYRELQEMAIDFIEPLQYENLINEANARRTITHNKYTYHNIIKVSPEKLIITGFEKSGHNVQITDLAYVIRRIMQKNNWDIQLLVDIIEEYSKIRSISSSEFNILKGMIIFPEKFASLCNKYYNSKRRWNYNMFYRKLINMLEYQDAQIVCAKQILDL